MFIRQSNLNTGSNVKAKPVTDNA